MGELLETVEPLIAPQIARKDLAYTCEPCDHDLCMLADPEKTAQILLNLISTR